jgi:hypothetical protein
MITSVLSADLVKLAGVSQMTNAESLTTDVKWLLVAVGRLAAYGGMTVHPSWTISQWPWPAGSRPSQRPEQCECEESQT